MNGNKARALYEDELFQWDELLNSSTQSTVFHKSEWLTTCGKLSNKKILIIGEFKNNNLIGGCSLLIKKFPALKLAYSLEKLTPYGGFILRNSESKKVRDREKASFSAFASISDKIKEMEFDYINIVNSPAMQDLRPFIVRGWHPNLYYTYILPLVGDIERNISKDVRWTIRKAKKKGITIKKYYDKDMYWDLNVETYKRQGTTPPFSQEYLFGLLEMITQNNLGEMWIAETDTGEPACAEVFVWDKNMAHRWSAASNTKFLDSGAVSLLMFNIFLDLKERDFRMVNLMGGNVSKISTFISSFNPSIVPYFGLMNSSVKYKLAGQLLKMKKRILR